MTSPLRQRQLSERRSSWITDTRHHEALSLSPNQDEFAASLVFTGDETRAARGDLGCYVSLSDGGKHFRQPAQLGGSLKHDSANAASPARLIELHVN